MKKRLPDGCLSEAALGGLLVLPPPFSLIPLEFSFSSSTTRTMISLIQAGDAGFDDLWIRKP